MHRKTVKLGSVLLGTLTAIALAGCQPTNQPPTQTPAPSTVTVTQSVPTSPDASAPTTPDATGPGTSPASPPPPQTTTATDTGSIADRIGQVPEIDPAPYRSELIFPAQSGLQFVGPDGTFCEIYGEGASEAPIPVALCTHDGGGEINAVSVREGEAASVHNVNRIFTAHEQTVELAAGAKLANGPVSCAVEAGSVQVLCAIGEHGFAVDKSGVELG